MDRTSPAWRKSSYSGGSGSNGDCVEVAHNGLAVTIRDSKSPRAGVRTLPPTAWRALLTRTCTQKCEP